MASPDIYIDPLTHDLAIEKGRLRLTQGNAERARQSLTITLNTFRGEWIFNTLYGVPYLQNEHNDIQLLGKNTKAILDYEIRKAILNTEGIKNIYEYSSIFSSSLREVKVNFKAETDTGEIIFMDGVEAQIGGG